MLKCVRPNSSSGGIRIRLVLPFALILAVVGAPALAQHDPGVLLADIATGPDGATVSATFVPSVYFRNALAGITCPGGAATAGFWYANVVPEMPASTVCTNTPTIYPFAGDPIQEEGAGMASISREEIYPGVPYLVELTGPNARMIVRGSEGAAHGEPEWGADHRTHMFRFHTWGNPAFDSFSVRITPALTQTDVRMLGDCSSGLLELRVEATLAVIASNACEGDLPAPDLDAGVAYLFTFTAFGFCQPECLGQFDVGIRGVPEAT